jgi:hypothetical protein
MKKYLVETVSMFRHRYVIECEDGDHAMDEVTMEAAEEFGQHHIAENIVSCRQIDNEEVCRLFFEDHPYLKEWGDEKAMEYVHKIDYDKK